MTAQGCSVHFHRPLFRPAIAHPCKVSTGSPVAPDPAESSSFHLRSMQDRDFSEDCKEIVFFRKCHEPTS
jgi:hypothetical protein